MYFTSIVSFSSTVYTSFHLESANTNFGVVIPITVSKRPSKIFFFLVLRSFRGYVDEIESDYKKGHILRFFFASSKICSGSVLPIFKSQAAKVVALREPQESMSVLRLAQLARTAVSVVWVVWVVWVVGFSSEDRHKIDM